MLIARALQHYIFLTGKCRIWLFYLIQERAECVGSPGTYNRSLGRFQLILRPFEGLLVETIILWKLLRRERERSAQSVRTVNPRFFTKH